MGKVAGQWVTFRASARIGAIAASLAAAAALLLPSTALASPAQIGSAQGDTQCNLLRGPFDSFQLTSQGVSYAVPPGGTSITSWSVQGYSGDTGPVALEVWNPTPPVYTLVGMSAPQTPAVGMNTFDLTSTPIPVQAGDLIGLRVEGPLTCMQSTQNFADSIWFDFQASGINVLHFVELNVAATVDVPVTPPPPPPPTRTTKDQCKDGGWQGLTDTNGTPFKNQGDCVSFVATKGTNAAGAPPADATNAGNGPPADATNAGNGPPADATNAGNGPPADATNAGNGPPADATNAGNGPPAEATNAGNGPPADATNAGNGPPADATNAGNGPPA
jgi:hypothetical protein